MFGLRQPPPAPSRRKPPPPPPSVGATKPDLSDSSMRRWAIEQAIAARTHGSSCKSLIGTAAAIYDFACGRAPGTTIEPKL